MTKQALSTTKRKARTDFNLELRVSIIPAHEIYKRNSHIDIARMKLSSSAHIAMAKGHGLLLAEELTKKTSDFELLTTTEIENAHAGLECRWNPIQSTKGEILTLIVQSVNVDNSLIYRKILNDLLQISPDLNLASSESMVATWPPTYLLKELKMKYSPLKSYILYSLLLIWTGFLSLVINKTRKDPNSQAAKYIEELTKNTDFIKFDETLRMVIDITQDQKNKILSLLESYKKNKEIFYGVQSSNEALMTCFIQTNKDHIHFVDGGSGGYALAAKQLKSQRLT
jgi:hypothetical protein